MKKISLDKYLIGVHQLVMNENELTRVLRTIDSLCERKPFMLVNNRRWIDKESTWVVTIITTNTKWYKLINELHIVRIWKGMKLPTNNEGRVYSED